MAKIFKTRNYLRFERLRDMRFYLVFPILEPFPVCQGYQGQGGFVLKTRNHVFKGWVERNLFFKFLINNSLI